MKKIMVILGLLAFVGCEQGKNEMSFADMDLSESSAKQSYVSEDLMVMENTVQSNKPMPPIGNKSVFRNLKLIKKGDVSFESDDLAATEEVIQRAIRAHGAYASNENESKSTYQVRRNISIRVPSAKFDRLLSDISVGVKEFDERSITVSDVTEEFYDLSARLKTKKEIEARYIQILSRAGKITEVLEVEKQIGEIREEIERVEGRLKYIKNQVSMSTLDITYYKVLSVKSENNDGFGHKITKSFVRGWDMLLGVGLAFVSIWPLLILATLVFLAIRRWRKKK
ncbi:MAG: DUF4349 domain-containing protein [Bacteroidia bacterium]